MTALETALRGSFTAEIHTTLRVPSTWPMEIVHTIPFDIYNNGVNTRFTAAGINLAAALQKEVKTRLNKVLRYVMHAVKPSNHVLSARNTWASR